jgi:uncharacterized protein (DUF697 family)
LSRDITQHMAMTGNLSSAKTLFSILKEINLDAIRRSSDAPFELVLGGSLAPQILELLQPNPGQVNSGQSPSRIRISTDTNQLQNTPTIPKQGIQNISGLTVSCLHSKAGKTFTYEEPLHVSLLGESTDVQILPNHLLLTDVSVKSVQTELIPALFERLPEELHLPLARHIPLARTSYSKRLTDETAKANAVYAASTALGGFIPVVNVPLNVADMMILTKNQLVMAYKLALAYGKTGTPISVMTEMIGVLGSGFFFRQLARGLVGFIPGWGVLPKIAVAYAGTYLVGQGVSVWLRDGQTLTQRELERFYTEALAKGKKWAASLRKKPSPLSENQASPEQMDDAREPPSQPEQH